MDASTSTVNAGRDQCKINPARWNGFVRCRNGFFTRNQRFPLTSQEEGGQVGTVFCLNETGFSAPRRIVLTLCPMEPRRAREAALTAKINIIESDTCQSRWAENRNKGEVINPWLVI